MTKSRITLSVSRDVPFNKLRLSQANVRHVKAGVSIEELAEDMARRPLLTSLPVRPILDDAGVETGFFEIPAGGRRFRALERLVKQKRLNKTAPVPFVGREAGLAEEDSLAENIQRAPLHPLDQFRAFLAMCERGVGEEEIAAAFFVSVGVVRQRLRLAAVSPKLLDVYSEDGLTLEQLIAFTVNTDHQRQEAVWEAISKSYSKEPYTIRRMLTEDTTRASDRRARSIRRATYEDAGGEVFRDLFESDDGGWLQDAGLLDRLVAEKLNSEAESVAAEGWRWVEVAPELPYGHAFGLRRLVGEPVAPTDEESAAAEALQAEYEKLESDRDGAEELPEEVDARLGEIEIALEAHRTRPTRYDADEMARAGAFISIDVSGQLRVERGFVRPEHEAPVEAPEPAEDAGQSEAADDTAPPEPAIDPTPVEDDGDDHGMRPLPDRLVAELTAHRTLALRDALANDPDLAFRAGLHVVCLKLFYRYGPDSCLEIEAKQLGFSAHAPGLVDSPSAKAIQARHDSWAGQLPRASADLWAFLGTLDRDSRESLFAHCVSLTLHAVDEAYHRRPGALAHANTLAAATGLDMAAVGWRPTVESFLGRVTKGRILAAVSEANGSAAAERIAHLKKPEMACEAEILLSESGWLPEPLRTPGRTFDGADEASPKAVVETTAEGGASAIDDPDADLDTEPGSHNVLPIAAE